MIETLIISDIHLGSDISKVKHLISKLQFKLESGQIKKLLKKKSELTKKYKKIEEEDEDVLVHAEFVEHELFLIDCDKDEINMKIKELKEKKKKK